MRIYDSLKFRLIFFCSILTLCLTLIFGVWLYRSLSLEYQSKRRDSISYAQSTVLFNLDASYQQLQRYAQLLSVDEAVSDFLRTPTIIGKDFTYKMVRAQEAMKGVTAVNNLSYVKKMMLYSRSNYRSILAGSTSGMISNITDFYRLCPYTESTSFYPYKIKNNPFRFSYDVGNVLPLKLPVYSNSKHAGDLYIALDTELFLNELEVFSECYLILGDNCYLVRDGQIAEADYPLPEAIQYYNVDLNQYNNHIVLDDINGTEGILSKSSITDLYLLTPVSDFSIFLPFKNILTNGLLIWTVVIFIFVFFYITMQKFITRPIQEIKLQLQQVAKGNFNSFPVTPASNIQEFAEISVQINQVAQDISDMISKLQQEEANKRNFEFQLLQNQIHPHFIYNTLNSIRWLAEINGLPNIVDMTTSLSNMLKRVFRSTSEWTTVSEELAFIREYTHLQSFRYGDTFRMEYKIDDDSLYQKYLLSFTLQPLVENAIFHGIEPAKRRGVIQIHIWKQDQDLILTVRDNGTGMKQTNLDALKGHASHADQMSGIGLRNIHQRIFLEFGAPYGLTIESVPNEFTCIHIRFPLLDSPPVLSKKDISRTEL